MSYTYILNCDDCGAATKPHASKSSLQALVEHGGWLSSRHEGKHYCRNCRERHEKPPKKARPSAEQYNEIRRAKKIERAKIAQRMRGSGMTYAQIGQALEVSATRAAQICATQVKDKIETIDTDQSHIFSAKPSRMPSSFDHLSVRAQMFCKELAISTLDELASKTESEILRHPRLGRKALNELKLLLANNGMNFRDNIS